MELMDWIVMSAVAVVVALALGLLTLATVNRLRRRHRVPAEARARLRQANAARMARYLDATRESRAAAEAERRAREAEFWRNHRAHHEGFRGSDYFLAESGFLRPGYISSSELDN